MEFKFGLAVITSTSLLLSACATQKIPPEELANYALIRTTGNSRVCAIDNVWVSKSLLCLTQEENVKPGHHTINVGYSDKVVTAKCDTLANHVYEINRINATIYDTTISCDDKGNRPDVWQAK